MAVMAVITTPKVPFNCYPGRCGCLGCGRIKEVIIVSTKQLLLRNREKNSKFK